MSFTNLCLLTGLVYAPGAAAEAGGLRRPLPSVPMGRNDVESLLMNELSNAFRGGKAREHISSLEVELTDMYTVVPKLASGGLGHATVRYMLQRFFLKKHGWFIRGLEPPNSTTLEAMAGGNQTLLEMQKLSEWVPGYLQEFMEDMQGGRGISLRELAVLATTLENIIHKESTQRLEMTFTELELPFTAELNEEQAQQALETYLIILIFGGHIEDLRMKEGQHILDVTEKVWDWENVKRWMHTLLEDVADIGEPVDFTLASHVTDEVVRRYGSYNDAQCGDLKAELLEVEATKAGRVRLADFYKKGLTGVFAFTEKVEYLRALGSLDESNASDPHIIIPNYVAGQQNCLKASEFYLVCCRNECEQMLAVVEANLKTPIAKPEQILRLAATFSTATVLGPRTLSDSLVRRLNSIADSNQGQVPLHGRLFAQWMHHAFPRECPYPQQSGDVAPMTANEWMRATGHESSSKTSEEMRFIVESDSRILPVGEKAREQHHLVENELPWDEAEELLPDSSYDVVSLHAPNPKTPQRSMFISTLPVFFILGAAGFAWKMTRSMKVSRWRDGLMV